MREGRSEKAEPSALSQQSNQSVTLVIIAAGQQSARITRKRLVLKLERGRPTASSMGVVTSKASRRSTRVRVEMPVSVISLDRMRPFAEQCKVLVVSAQGCGFQSSRALQLETPIMINDLPGGGSVTGRVANCLPLGNDGKYFLIGVSLYTHGNVWGIANPPEDWNTAASHG